MGSEIYEAFVRAFVTASDWMNMTRVEPVAPFEVCYGGGRAVVPVVDVVLQSEMVRWKIHGHNSMVEVGDDDGVMCLGFLNGGLDLGASIVIGGHQLDDNLMEFDLESSMMGFSSSLLMKGTSCSDISLHSARKPHESI
ncbi:hypothetical protein Nepgr_010240 [Nepenthes gracilis]|uniref:Peptidase A1 domain-containing protein n=1 Tax=Nepenthes gracilis TaxID=150966 RepID=A0AAD3XL48_NEPGR|nr:hypothetical protein Nepgr_010240 [Nepenthes gracilis]